MVLGIVVDDAIVIGENIFRKREEGLKPLKAAIEGALEVGKPVIFAVLTTIAAFWPLLSAGGIMGKILRNIPLVVIVVLLGSLVEALMILPSHLSGRGARPSKEKFTSVWLKWFIRRPYNRLLRFCLRWRYAALGLGIAAILLTAGLWTGGWVKFTFFPKVEGDVLFCSLTMPTGTPVDRTTEVVSQIESAAKEALESEDEKRTPGSESLFQHSISIIGLHMAGHGPSAGGAEIGRAPRPGLYPTA